MVIRDKIFQNLSKYWQSVIKYSKICQNIGNPWVRQQRTPLCNSTARFKLFKCPSSPSIIRQAAGQLEHCLAKYATWGGNKSRKQENWFGGKWTNLGSADRAAAEQSESWNCSNVCQEMQFSSQFDHFLEITLVRVLKQAILLEDSICIFHQIPWFFFHLYQLLIFLPFLPILDVSAISAKTWLFFPSQLGQCQCGSSSTRDQFLNLYPVRC